MKPGPDGRLYAINPESGLFRRCSRHELQNESERDGDDSRDTIYTNVALTPDRRCLVGRQRRTRRRQSCMDWKGNRWTPDSKEKAAHPNSRFAAPMTNNPMLAPEANDPKGVPISAIIFGGRRATTMPLVYQAFNWIHGVYRRGDDGLRNHGRRRRHGRTGAPRSDGDAAFLRLQHGRLFPALAEHAQS